MEKVVFVDPLDPFVVGANGDVSFRAISTSLFIGVDAEGRIVITETTGWELGGVE